MKINIKHLVLLSIILAAAFAVRFYDLETSSFEGHILRDIEIAESIAYDHEIRLAGVTHKIEQDSGQQSFGPLYYYMLALPLMFTKDSISNPIIIISIIALLNVCAVFLLYRLGKDFFSEKVGLIAATLLALSPWDILYSRFITTPNFLPFFVIILAYSLLKIVLKKDYRYFIPLAVAGALSLHFHLSVLFLAPVVGLILVLSKLELKPKYVLACIAIFALALAPMLYYNISNDSLGSLNFLSERIGEEFSRSEAALESFGIPLVVSSNYLGKYWFGNANIFSDFGNWFYLASSVLIASLFIFGMIYLARNFVKKKSYGVLLDWILIPILIIVLLGKNVSPHFFVIIMPAMFIVIALALEHLSKKTALAYLLLAIVIISNVFTFYTAFDFLQENGGTSSAFGLSYKAKMEVVDYITSIAPDKTTPIFFLDYNKRDFLYLFNKLGYTNISGISLEEFEKQKEGVLIVDRYSMFGYAEHKLTEEQNDFLDKADKITIKNIEIVSAPGEIGRNYKVIPTLSPFAS